ncbi:dihydromonapterin reductase [Shewanella sp. NFH-SH190041]|uniref:dihydromonapterin reductase n=1 Tax=Shewanella sp. NFH-SH190041 TaxID=2950245 RepID=UPI0021C30265|nr:dihydromonapterin reductase [Shewanella sp. NFH-SH190041]BDM63491.1 dihydromonapterin reductase [Shewanella sp. NFH-SH190041]
MTADNQLTHPVLITGVGRRAGFFLARTMLETGQAVIGTYRSQRAEIEQLLAMGAHLYPVDFCCQSQVEQFIAVIQRDVPVLRAIIHNASQWLPDDVALSHHEIMQQMMQIHVNVPYQINMALAEKLMARADFFTHSAPNSVTYRGEVPDSAAIGCADIIHISDFIVSKGSQKHIAYAASKAALDNLTLSFAAQLAPSVKVNSIAPALLRFNDGDTEAYRQKALQKALLPKEGSFDELFAMVQLLMESRYITGRVMPLDGGRHLK